jgi:hypothetical protein
MSFIIEGKTEEWSTHNVPTDSFTSAITFHGGISGAKDYNVSYANLSFKRIRFVGQESQDFIEGLNLWSGITILGENIFEPSNGTFFFDYTKYLSGNVVINDCIFSTLVFPIYIFPMKDSHIAIIKNKINNAYYGIWLNDFDNSKVWIKYNNLDNIHWSGVRVNQGLISTLGYNFGPHPELFPSAPANFIIQMNDFSMTESGEGISLLDYGNLYANTKTLNALIRKNRICLNDGIYGGIWGVGCNDIIVHMNKIYGKGDLGIYFGIYGDPCESWKIIGNNLADLEATTAHIWLGSGSGNCIVIGKNDDINILDEGTNNIIKGFNKHQRKFLKSQRKETLEDKVEKFRKIRKR